MRGYRLLAFAVALAAVAVYTRPWAHMPGAVCAWTDARALVAVPAAQAAETPSPATEVRRAVVVLRPIGAGRAAGTLYLTQQGAAIQVTGTITGLTPGRHGFHVHQYGDLTDLRQGLSAGDHFNPTNMPHGAPDSQKRHVGDLGNITADARGTASVRITDRVIRLNGAHSVVGRALVVHSAADKFTQPSGDSGARVAFGVIGVRNPGR